MAGINEEIWAKSDGTTLIQHIHDCLQILKEQMISLPLLPEIAQLQSFWKLLFYAVYLHDLGKSHNEFQKVLRRQNSYWENQRHEVYSIPFVEKLSVTEAEKNLIKCAILGHHKTFEELEKRSKTEEDLELELKTVWEYRSSYRKLFPPDGQVFHPEDFKENLRYRINKEYPDFLFERMPDYFEEVFSKKLPFALRPVKVGELKHPITEIAIQIRKSVFNQNSSEYWQNMLFWGALKISDHYGSAKLDKIKRFDDNDFHYLANLQIKLNNENEDFYPHQKLCFKKNGNCILIAPTGSGKTEAAIGWLQNQLKNRQGRTFYVLPYTASINAMHKRLSSEINRETGSDHEDLIGVLHGKLTQYLASIYEDSSDSVPENIEKSRKIKAAQNLHRKMFYPLKIMTPFQILKYFYGVKGFEMGLTELAGSYLIFDEIHAYDVNTFAQLLICLKYLRRYLKAKTFIMTATLPSFMLSELMKILNIDQPIKADHDLLKKFIRHRVQLLEGNIFDQLKKIEQFILSGKRIIVVCNTVQYAQEIFKKIADLTRINSNNIVLLHSRFNSSDRLQKEKLAQNEDTKILIGTQAIEVSLDIDYDVMFTEPAPLDALLQRFGRVNRRMKKGISTVYVCKQSGANDHYIYPSSVVARSIKALESVDIIEESLLQSLLDFVYPDWEDDQKKEFQETLIGFENSLNSIQPYSAHKENEEDFYEKFDGIEVLPVCFVKKYQRLIENYDFIEAQKYFVTLHRGMYFKLKNDNLIVKCTIAFENINGNIETQSILVAKCKYSPALGLLNEPDIMHETNLFL